MSFSTTTLGRKIVNDDSLVLYLDAANPRSYPGSGDTWFDLSKYRQNVPLFNSPTFNNLGLGSLQFNGSTQYGRTLLSPGISQSPFTLSTWFYSISNDVGQAWTTIGAGSNQTLECILNFGNFGQFYCSDYLGMVMSANGNTLNAWNNVVILANSSFLYKMYINGVLAASSQGSSFSIQTSIMTIGAYAFGFNTPLSNFYFDGYISNYSIYNRALSEQEILQNYNATKGRFGIF